MSSSRIISSAHFSRERPSPVTCRDRLWRGADQLSESLPRGLAPSSQTGGGTSPSMGLIGAARRLPRPLWERPRLVHLPNREGRAKVGPPPPPPHEPLWSRARPTHATQRHAARRHRLERTRSGWSGRRRHGASVL